MLASSAFVLAALTMTGVYMKGQNVESRDDGYTLDFTALPNNADDKLPVSYTHLTLPTIA